MDDTTRAQVLKLLAQGLSSDDIARRLGVRKMAVAGVKAGLTKAGPGDAAGLIPDTGRTARFVMIRDEGQKDGRLVQESAIPTEAALHEVLMHHPTLVPATDLGFGRIVTVGFEASLASGTWPAAALRRRRPATW